MAAASIIERASSNGASKSFIGYAFCLKLKVNAVLQGLVWQIVQNHYLTVDQKLLILEAHRTRVRLPSDHMTQTERQEMLDLRNLIAKLLQPYKSVTLAFDGVDQATFPEDIVACISNIADSLLSSVKPFKLLVTSRQQSRGLRINDDQLRLHHLSLTSRDVTCDTEIFMRRLLSSLEPPLDAGLETVVVQKCLEAADGWPDFMHTLATKYVELGRPNEAEALELEVLSFREARQRENSEPILYSKRLLALILAEQGRLDRAEELQRSLLEISKRTRRDGDDLIRTFTNDLSLTLTHRDAAPEKKREAITLLEQIIDAWKTPEGDETEKSLTVANNLAVAYMEVDRLEEGEALMHRAIAGSALLHGENSRASLAHKCNLAQLYARQKRWAEAEALDLEVLEVRKRTLGMDNPITIQCMSSIGWAYSQQGRLEEAKEFQLQVLERRMRLQGATHPDTIGILGNLAETVAKLGEMNDARRYARMALGY